MKESVKLAVIIAMQKQIFLGVLVALVLLPGSAEARYRGEVSGWVPWWTEDEGVESVTKNVSKIDILYPFIYEIEGGGDIKAKVDIKDGVWEELLDKADDKRVDIIPTIAWFDGEGIHAVLSDQRERKELVNDIVRLVKKNKFDGINIDFEQKWAETIDDHSLFLKELNTALGHRDLTCTVEARMRPENRWRPENIPEKITYANDYKAMNKHCDWVEIMAYDQQRADLLLNDKRKGVPYNPVADIDWVESVLDFALKDFDKDKVMVGIPTYGRAWDVTVAPEWYRDYKQIASVNHSRAVELADEIYKVPVGRTAGGEAVITYFPDDSPWKLLNQLPTPKGTPKGFEAAAKALQVATYANVEIPVRILTWGDAKAAEDKLDLAAKLNLKGVTFFKLDGTEDKAIWKLF